MSTSGRIDTRERMLLLMQLLNLPHGISVKGFQNYCLHIYGIAPNRKMIYQDLYSIEKYLPLKVLQRTDGRTYYGYSFSLIGGVDWKRSIDEER